MPIQAKCPGCGAVYTLVDDQRGKRVRCRKCDDTFVVGTAIKAQAPAPPPPPPRRDSVRLSPAAAPVARRRFRDEEDEDTPPDRKERKSSNVPWIVGGALAGLLILVGGVVAVVAMSNSRKDGDDKPVAQAKPVGAPDGVTPPGGGVPPVGGFGGGVGGGFPPNNFTPPGGGTPPGGTIPVGSNPGGGTPPAQPVTPVQPSKPFDPTPATNGELTEAVLDKIKRATVHLRVKTSGGVAEGSGFFAFQSRLVLTNAHVLGMLRPDSQHPSDITVTINSGQKDERKVGASILGVDRFTDLAVLDVGGTAGMPPPLEVKFARNLRETQEVYVVGFPLGSRLGSEVSVRKSSVAALRKKNKNSDTIDRVQVQGGMDPGNSGGPVVDRHGNVVGVSVSGIVGTQINFAIPGEHVHAILAGRLSEVGKGQPYVSGSSVAVPITMKMIDPRLGIHDVAMDVWTGPPGPSRPPATGTAPAPRPGDGKHQRVLLNYTPANAEAKGEVILPPLPMGHVYWMQPAWTNAANEVRWASATPYRVTTVPVERRPIQIAYRAPAQVSRPVALSEIMTFKLQGPDGESFEHKLRMTSLLTEQIVSSGANGYSVSLRINRAQFSQQRGNQPVRERVRYARIAAYLTRASVTYAIDGSGNLHAGRPILGGSRIGPPIRIRPGRGRPRPVGGIGVPSDVADEVAGFVMEVQQSLEAMAVPLPNRMVQPGENWQASRTLPIDSPGRRQSGSMEMTYTYLGCRKREGRDEAVIGVRGRLQSSGLRKSISGGKASGTALIDLATGQVTLARASLTVDMEAKFSDGPAIKAVCSMDVEMKRTVR